MPRVSVIITTIRRPEMVQTAIQSVLRQTYTDFEVLVVIDGPDAETSKALQPISDVRVHVIERAENVGSAEARNFGVRTSKGEWIAFLDDDDEWFPEKLDLQVKEAERLGGHEVLIVSQYLEKTNSMQRIWPEKLPSGREAFSEYMYLERGQLLPSTFFVSASLANRFPFSKGLVFEDPDWLLRIAADPKLKIGGVAKPLAVYNNFQLPGRQSRNVPWRALFQWAMSRRELFTARAFSFFLVKSVVTAARESNAPLRERFFILCAALLLGSFSPKVFFFFFASAFVSRESKRKIRELVSPRARRARVSDVK